MWKRLKIDLKSLGVYPCTSSILVPGTNKNRKLKAFILILNKRLFCFWLILYITCTSFLAIGYKLSTPKTRQKETSSCICNPVPLSRLAHSPVLPVSALNPCWTIRKDSGARWWPWIARQTARPTISGISDLWLSPFEKWKANPQDKNKSPLSCCCSVSVRFPALVNIRPTAWKRRLAPLTGCPDLTRRILSP